MGQFDRNVQEARKQAAAGNLTGALQSTSFALLEKPRDGNLKLFRARLLHALGRHREALADLSGLSATGPSPQLASFRAEVAENAGDLKTAITALTHALPATKTPSPLLAKRAVLYQSLGQFAKAKDDLIEAIRLTPADGELFRLLSAMHRFQASDPLLARMEKTRPKLKKNSLSGAHMDFALSKAFDDLGDTDKSFKLLLQANAAMRLAFPYDANARQTQLDHYKVALANLPDAPSASDAAPIFVTGLPRSGTTLVEQILSAHPDVAGGGEMALFGGLMRKSLGDPASSAPLKATPEALSKLGHAYAKAASARHPKAKRITDKSIQTASYIGAVTAALPNARIIVVRRNPNGNALSLLRQVFLPGKQSFSYNLDDIRSYQQGFDDMVSFWQESLPDKVHVVQFEDLVSTPEQTTRSLLDMAALEWNDACLRPQDNDRAVQTLSAVAVRQPITPHSSQKWQAYAEHLGA
ncbi:MAG: sulfotransferase [Litoreibacter sp.]|uniref:tetratricopeptide repeat-containing sulfotransferase family protein n=1 Tax=Litoreibacter sp. TaxID=1969459 RepID=UPI0032999F22